MRIAKSYPALQQVVAILSCYVCRVSCYFLDSLVFALCCRVLHLIHLLDQFIIRMDKINPVTGDEVKGDWE